MRSQKSMYNLEGLNPILDASVAPAACEPLSPSGLFTHGSSLPLDLNTVLVMEGSADAGDESMKSQAKDGGAMFIKRPSMPDNGPAMNFRNCGA